MSFDDVYPYQIEVEMPSSGADDCVAAMTEWLAYWEVEHAVRPSSAGARHLTRFGFTDLRYARAFKMAFGGTLYLPEDEIEALKVQMDIEEEDRLERLARSYPD
ncbi:hypothetical protein [Bosea sp. RAC05]|uniref:hypothetical protein n=1 Tax=Bosea sp. RAC05 TaxID=1842539 RepID=UPI0008587997|nr:hypothetical protein [Bosea sp. RAC05]AOG03203.1 hypothetical protein BSY19_4859 [Bosea sp. RAC05]